MITHTSGEQKRVFLAKVIMPREDCCVIATTHLTKLGEAIEKIRRPCTGGAGALPYGEPCLTTQRVAAKQPHAATPG
jgi:hypothetical protein